MTKRKRCQKCGKLYNKNLKWCPACLLQEAAGDLSQKLHKAGIKIL